MFFHSFNTDTPGLIADEIQVGGLFRFGLFNAGDFIILEYDGVNLSLNDSGAGESSQALAIADNDNIGIEYDIETGNYRVIHNNNEIVTGNNLLAGECFFNGFSLSQGQRVIANNFSNSYGLGAKDYLGNLI